MLKFTEWLYTFFFFFFEKACYLILLVCGFVCCIIEIGLLKSDYWKKEWIQVKRTFVHRSLEKLLYIWKYIHLRVVYLILRICCRICWIIERRNYKLTFDKSSGFQRLPASLMREIPFYFKGARQKFFFSK